MENTTMRSLDLIMKDLNLAANEIQAKRKALEELNEAQSKAATALDNAQKNAVALRGEMEDFLNLLVPASFQSRVRSS